MAKRRVIVFKNDSEDMYMYNVYIKCIKFGMQIAYEYELNCCMDKLSSAFIDTQMWTEKSPVRFLFCLQNFNLFISFVVS